MSHKITVFRGDGIGPELVDNVLKILKAADAPLDTRRGRVAGNHDRLDSLCFQKTDDLAGIAQHRLLRFASIWNARRISKVYDTLLRHLTHDLTGYRQTADA